MKDKIFDNELIDTVLDEIAGKLDSKVSILLIGGGAMALQDTKESTKDIDVVLMDEPQFNAFTKALHDDGFKEDMRFEVITDAPEKEFGSVIYKDKRGYLVDMFMARICRRFLVNEGVLKRAKKYRKIKRLDILL